MSNLVSPEVKRAVKKAFNMRSQHDKLSLFNPRRIYDKLRNEEIYLTNFEIIKLTHAALLHKDYEIDTARSLFLQTLMQNKNFYNRFYNTDLTGLNEYQLIKFCEAEHIPYHHTMHWNSFMYEFIRVIITSKYPYLWDEINKEEEKEVPMQKTDFASFTTLEEFTNNDEFIQFFHKEIAKYRNASSPHVNLWYAIYELTNSDTGGQNELHHQIVEYYGYLEKDDEIYASKEEIEESVQQQITQFKNQKEIIMNLTTPVTTGITYTVNNQDVNNMSKDTLFASAMELKNSIKLLKKCGIKAKAVKTQIKEQKVILATVLKYLDAKK